MQNIEKLAGQSPEIIGPKLFAAMFAEQLKEINGQLGPQRSVIVPFGMPARLANSGINAPSGSRIVNGEPLPVKMGETVVEAGTNQVLVREGAPAGFGNEEIPGSLQLSIGRKEIEMAILAENAGWASEYAQEITDLVANDWRFLQVMVQALRHSSDVETLQEKFAGLLGSVPLCEAEKEFFTQYRQLTASKVEVEYLEERQMHIPYSPGRIVEFRNDTKAQIEQRKSNLEWVKDDNQAYFPIYASIISDREAEYTNYQFAIGRMEKLGYIFPE